MYLICKARPLADQWECDAANYDETKYYEIWKF
jgi:hypothetical protein